VQPDSVLVGLVKNGDTGAYEHLVVRYRRAAMLVALRFLRDYHASEDAVQDSFVIAFRRLGLLRDGSKFGPWLMRIVRRQALQAARKRRAAVSVESVELPAPPADPEPDECEQMVELLNRLPVHERLVIVLRYLEGHSTTEIAEIAGRPVGTVTKQLSRALRRLRELVKMRGLSR
jgi:RNA polymerase sigma-70 factor (ECF subfamily)